MDYVAASWVAVHLGAISVLLHTSILLVQVFITVHDFSFLRYFLAGCGVQLIALLAFHGNFAQVVGALYLGQIVVIIPLGVQLMKYSQRYA